MIKSCWQLAKDDRFKVVNSETSDPGNVISLGSRNFLIVWSLANLTIVSNLHLAGWKQVGTIGAIHDHIWSVRLRLRIESCKGRIHPIPTTTTLNTHPHKLLLIAALAAVEDLYQK
jgi:hypothetical protein